MSSRSPLSPLRTKPPHTPPPLPHPLFLPSAQLDDVIMKCPLPNKARLSSEQKKEEMLKRMCFLNFLQGARTHLGPYLCPYLILSSPYTAPIYSSSACVSSKSCKVQQPIATPPARPPSL